MKKKAQKLHEVGAKQCSKDDETVMKEQKDLGFVDVSV